MPPADIVFTLDAASSTLALGVMNVTALAACGQAAESNMADTTQRITAFTVFIRYTGLSCEMFNQVVSRNQSGDFEKREHNLSSTKIVKPVFDKWSSLSSIKSP